MDSNNTELYDTVDNIIAQMDLIEPTPVHVTDSGDRDSIEVRSRDLTEMEEYEQLREHNINLSQQQLKESTDISGVIKGRPRGHHNSVLGREIKLSKFNRHELNLEPSCEPARIWEGLSKVPVESPRVLEALLNGNSVLITVSEDCTAIVTDKAVAIWNDRKSYHGNPDNVKHGDSFTISYNGEDPIEYLIGNNTYSPVPKGDGFVPSIVHIQTEEGDEVMFRESLTIRLAPKEQ